MLNSVTVSCPGRVCLAGEYLDWLSGPSLLGAIRLRLRIRLSWLPANSDCLVFESGLRLNITSRIPLSDLGAYGNQDIDLIHAAAKVVFDNGVSVRPVQISVQSDLPIAAGLASSAAIAVATVTGLARLAGETLSPMDACALACHAETEELHTGAGKMDFYVCGLGGLMYLNSRPTPPDPIIHFRLPEDVRIVIADTQITRRTESVARFVRERYQNLDPRINRYTHEVGLLVDTLRNIFEARKSVDLAQVGSIMNSCHARLKSDMLVSSELLDLCVAKCLENGALGAKLTGSGVGGSVFALVRSAHVAQVRKALNYLPVKVHITDIEPCGVRVEHCVS